jgi:hypothetical protein
MSTQIGECRRQVIKSRRGYPLLTSPDRAALPQVFAHANEFHKFFLMFLNSDVTLKSSFYTDLHQNPIYEINNTQSDRTLLRK